MSVLEPYSLRKERDARIRNSPWGNLEIDTTTFNTGTLTMGGTLTVGGVIYISEIKTFEKEFML